MLKLVCAVLKQVKHYANPSGCFVNYLYIISVSLAQYPPSFQAAIEMVYYSSGPLFSEQLLGHNTLSREVKFFKPQHE